MGTKFFSVLARFSKDEDGASMVEYGVALLVVVAIGVTAMTFLGDGVAANIGLACDAIYGTDGTGCVGAAG